MLFRSRNGKINDYIGDLVFEISPLSFFQVNPVQTEVLYNKALEYHQQCYEMRIKLFNNQDHFQIAYSLSSLGKVHHSFGEYNKALDYYQQSYEMRKRLFHDQDHSDITLSLDDFGNIFCDIGEYQLSLRNYQKSLEMAKRIFNTEDHNDIAICTSNIGRVYLQSHEVKLAIDTFQEALKNIKNPQTFNYLGKAYNECGEFGKALDSHHKALSSYQSLYAKLEFHPDIAETIVLIGIVFFSKGDIKSALENFEKVLKMKQKFSNSNHQIISDALHYAGCCYL